MVRHGGRESVFDWASDDAHSVRWAAFFADCEHEVLEVTRGHRVTLTYNLYWTTYGPSFMSRHLAGLELDRLPFFHVLERLVNSAEVQARGETTERPLLFAWSPTISQARLWDSHALTRIPTRPSRPSAIFPTASRASTWSCTRHWSCSPDPLG